MDLYSSSHFYLSLKFQFLSSSGNVLNLYHHLLQVPRDFLLQILGEDRVTKFVIQEIITSTLADYVKKASPLILLFTAFLMELN